MVLGDGWIRVSETGREERPSEVFNLTVASCHNFYVAERHDRKYLTHNKGTFPCFAEGARVYLAHNKSAPVCFAEGHRVTRSEGQSVPVERVRRGDELWAYDLKARRWGAHRVTEIQGGAARDHIRINNSLNVSPNHFLRVNGHSVQAWNVREGDLMVRESGRSVRVSDVEFVRRPHHRFNPVLGEQEDLIYFVDGFSVYNSW